ncbi:MAG TPA: hypothetical protein VFI14_05740, partial [Chryseosolibacter sp.]|nr:hypothetical protein [Chryseosolibacter sp.]
SVWGLLKGDLRRKNLPGHRKGLPVKIFKKFHCAMHLSTIFFLQLVTEAGGCGDAKITRTITNWT